MLSKWVCGACALVMGQIAVGQIVTTTRASLSTGGAEVQYPHSDGPTVSGNGRYIFFTSNVCNYLAGDANDREDVYRRDLSTGAIELVSKDALGKSGPNGAFEPQSSFDGRYVVFNSFQWWDELPNQGHQVFRKDMVTGAIQTVSVSTGKKALNDRSYQGSISDDGRYIAFYSDASNAVTGDTNGTGDVFVYDVQSQVTERVSVSSAGAQANGYSGFPLISGSGRYVIFQSNASNLVANDTNGKLDIFVRDRVNGTTTRVSVNSAGQQGDYDSRNGVISNDGTVVAYSSFATNMDGTSAGEYVYMRNLSTNQTRRISRRTNNDGAQAWNPQISPDGRYVAYMSWDSFIVANDTNNSLDVYLYDRSTDTNSLMSITPGGTQVTKGLDMLWNSRGSLSENANILTFWSGDTAFDTTDTNGVNDVFVKNRSTGAITRVSAVTGGEKGGGNCDTPRMTPDGRYVFYKTVANTLVANDTNDSVDVFRYDRQTKATIRVSVSNTGAQLQWGGYNGESSADGNLVVFTSWSRDVVTGDSNDRADLFLRNISAGTTTLLSKRTDGVQTNADIHWPHITPDGRYVTFESTATNLVTGVTDGRSHVYRLDRTTGAFAIADVSLTNTPGNGNAWGATVSDDGRYVAFTSASTDLTSGDTNNSSDIYVRDMTNGVTKRASLGNLGEQPVSWCDRAVITGDGSKLIFATVSGNLVTGDTNNDVDVFLRDLVANTTVRVSTASNGAQAQGDGGSISANGRYVTFYSWNNAIVPNDTNNTRDVFRKDMLTGKTIRVNVTSTGAQANNYSLWWESQEIPISDDGTVVAYPSHASNLSTPDTNQNSDIFVGYVSDIAVSSVTVGSATLCSGESTTLTVAISVPAPAGGALVQLTSNNPGALPVPATLLIPVGLQRASTTITAANVAGSAAVTITGSFEGRSANRLVNVRPWLTSLTISPTTVVGGRPSLATLNLTKAAPTAGLVVALASSNTAVAQVPATVTVTAGATNVTFPISTLPQSASMAATISASYLGATLKSNLTVGPVSVTALSLSGNAAIGSSQHPYGYITLNGPAPATGLAVSLTSSNPLAATTPSSITVPAGKSAVAFRIRTKEVSTLTTVTITAKSGTVSKTASLNVLPIAITDLAIFPDPPVSDSTVLAFIGLNARAGASGLAVTLVCDDPDVVLPTGSAVLVPAGESMFAFDFYVKPKTASKLVTLTATANGISKTIQFTVNP